MYEDFVEFVKDLYKFKSPVALHAPYFNGKEKAYLLDAIESTFVSSVGHYVNRFEKEFANYVDSTYAVAVVNGTAALHIALLLAGVQAQDEVITQPLTFVATCNAISYCQAYPLFIDVDLNTLGLSAAKLQSFFEQHTIQKNKACVNKITGNVVRACVPMHTFGHPVEIDLIAKLCQEHHVELIEDAAEALGSYYKHKHVGSYGKMSVFSFNGNKIITTGGGGMIVTNNEVLAKKAKHLTTTAKLSHPWEYSHDEIGYNYRMPNINAALGVAQLEQLDSFILKKRALAKQYQDFFAKKDDIKFIMEPTNAISNYWLNAIILSNKEKRDEFLRFTNNTGIMTRPTWQLINKLPMYKKCFTASDDNAKYLSERLINIPSGVSE
ncbi:MAG: aminotransferase DegT [Gammaproteobacteria bacterium RIFCSPHIGHO2_12_FULL_35_23]|nr:MAG: aminotransferase DegT [Gammaproteobacteria bacterium RIFCSPHIGHO2_12_FULL_35_23]